MVYNIMKDGTVRDRMAGVEIDRETMPELYDAIERLAAKNTKENSKNE